MKKLFSLILVAMLLTGFAAHADQPTGDGYSIMGQGGQAGLTPRTLVIPVRYGLRSAVALSLSSGDVVIWDTTSADGMTISACVTDNDSTFAGVLISTIQTADSSSLRRNSRNWGKMAIKGYCLAKVDTSASTAGMAIVPNGATLSRSLATTPTDGTQMSADMGVLLKDSGSDGLMPVWLR